MWRIAVMIVCFCSSWEWCGYQEIVGLRRRYRILDREALAEALAPGRGWDDVSKHYAETVHDALRGQRLQREACWTESLAVGGKAFIDRMSSCIPNRMEVQRVEADGLWLVRELSVTARFRPQKEALRMPKRPIRMCNPLML